MKSTFFCTAAYRQQPATDHFNTDFVTMCIKIPCYRGELAGQITAWLPSKCFALLSCALSLFKIPSFSFQLWALALKTTVVSHME